MHPSSLLSPSLSMPPDSGQETLRHPELSTYRCFLPDLTGFIALCRAGPGLQRRAGTAVSRGIGSRMGIQLRCSGLRIQGTASSPPSMAVV